MSTGGRLTYITLPLFREDDKNDNWLNKALPQTCGIQIDEARVHEAIARFLESYVLIRGVLTCIS